MNIEIIEQFAVKAVPFGGRIAACRRLGRWSVARCTFEAAGGQPAKSIIIKWLREADADHRTNPARIANEAAALAFLEALGFGGAPRLIAADFDAGLLAIEDLAPGVSLAELLESRPVPDLGALLPERLSFAETLADLHAATAGREDEFVEHRTRYGPQCSSRQLQHGLDPNWRSTNAALEACCGAMSDSANQDLDAALGILQLPGPLNCLSNGDTEVNNFIASAGKGYLIDFENAGFCHAFTGITWMYLPASTWITVSDPDAEMLENTYRRRLSAAIPQAQDDDVFEGGFAAACLTRALQRLERFRAMDARKRGDHSHPQMVFTIHAAVAVSRRYGRFAALCDWLSLVEDRLVSRWQVRTGDYDLPYIIRQRV